MAMAFLDSILNFNRYKMSKSLSSPINPNLPILSFYISKDDVEETLVKI